MALARLNIPGLMLYGGSIRPGHWKGAEVTIQQVFEAVGEFASGKITEQELHELEEAASPGAGACAGSSRRTRWRWRSRCSGSRRRAPRWCPPRTGASSRWRCRCGELVMDVLRRGQRPSDVITKPALENAIAAVATSGGSTNGVLHLLAVAREMGVPLEIDEFEAISERTPLLCDLQPGGQYVATELYEAGGVPLVLARLKRGGHAQRGRADGHRQDDRRARRRGARDRRPARRARRCRTRSNRPAALRSCAATSRPTAAWSSSPGTSGANTSGPRACSTARRRRWRPCSTTRSRRATWW